jgi:hypothetical protein
VKSFSTIRRTVQENSNFIVKKPQEKINFEEEEEEEINELPSNFRENTPLASSVEDEENAVRFREKPIIFQEKSTPKTTTASIQRQKKLFPVYNDFKRKIEINSNLQGFLSNKIKLFSKFKFKGFALTFIKSALDITSCGIGVKVPITPNFPIYDSMIHLPRIVGLVCVNYPYCWKFGATINVPIQVITMLMFLFLEFSNSFYQTLLKLNLVSLKSNDDHSNNHHHHRDSKKSSSKNHQEVDEELMNSFSDREVTATSSTGALSSPTQATTTASTATVKPALKSSESVKRVGITLSYKFTAWGAKGNGFSMGPAFNYVSSLIITNKLLPLMILISVSFFSVSESLILGAVWMYDIYSYVITQFLALSNAFIKVFSGEIQPVQDADICVLTEKVYYDTPSATAAATVTEQPDVSTFNPANSEKETKYFVTSNKDLGPPESLNPDYDYDQPSDGGNRRQNQEQQQPQPAAVLACSRPAVSLTENPQQQLKPSFLVSLRNHYHNYAQRNLRSQLKSNERLSSSSSSTSLWQTNWKQIERWMLTKSPVFGYSVSTPIVPFSNSGGGLKLSPNMNFDVQNIHPVEYLQKLLIKMEFDKSLENISKQTFLFVNSGGHLNKKSSSSITTSTPSTTIP